MFVHDSPGPPRFVALPAPSTAQVAQVAWSVCEQVVSELRRQNRWLDDDELSSAFAEREPALAACYAGSIQGKLVLGQEDSPIQFTVVAERG